MHESPGPAGTDCSGHTSLHDHNSKLFNSTQFNFQTTTIIENVGGLVPRPDARTLIDLGPRSRTGSGRSCLGSYGDVLCTYLRNDVSNDEQITTNIFRKISINKLRIKLVVCVGTETFDTLNFKILIKIDKCRTEVVVLCDVYLGI